MAIAWPRKSTSYDSLGTDWLWPAIYNNTQVYHHYTYSSVSTFHWFIICTQYLKSYLLLWCTISNININKSSLNFSPILQSSLYYNMPCWCLEEYHKTRKREGEGGTKHHEEGCCRLGCGHCQLGVGKWKRTALQHRYLHFWIIFNFCQTIFLLASWRFQIPEGQMVRVFLYKGSLLFVILFFHWQYFVHGNERLPFLHCPDKIQSHWM